MDLDRFEDNLPNTQEHVRIDTEYTTTPPSIAIISAIAELENANPTEIDITLYEEVDPEALDTLFDISRQSETNEATVSAEIRISEYDVLIHNTGEISVVKTSEQRS